MSTPIPGLEGHWLVVGGLGGAGCPGCAGVWAAKRRGCWNKYESFRECESLRGYECLLKLTTSSSLSLLNSENFNPFKQYYLEKVYNVNCSIKRVLINTISLLNWYQAGSNPRRVTEITLLPYDVIVRYPLKWKHPRLANWHLLRVYRVYRVYRNISITCSLPSRIYFSVIPDTKQHAIA